MVDEVICTFCQAKAASPKAAKDVAWIGEYWDSTINKLKREFVCKDCKTKNLAYNKEAEEWETVPAPAAPPVAPDYQSDMNKSFAESYGATQDELDSGVGKHYKDKYRKLPAPENIPLYGGPPDEIDGDIIFDKLARQLEIPRALAKQRFCLFFFGGNMPEKMTINWANILTLVQKLETDIPAAAGPVYQVIEDFVTAFTASAMKAVPKGSTDVAECLDCAISCQVSALAGMVQAKASLPVPPAPAPAAAAVPGKQ